MVLEIIDTHLKADMLAKVIAGLSAGFLVITFLQSGLNKLFQFSSNVEWMTRQFSKTIFRSVMKPMVAFLMVMEIASSLVVIAGLYFLFGNDQIDLLCFGFMGMGITFLMLLFGQRISGEYAGAASLAAYFIIVLFGLLSCLVMT